MFNHVAFEVKDLEQIILGGKYMRSAIGIHPIIPDVIIEALTCIAISNVHCAEKLNTSPTWT